MAGERREGRGRREDDEAVYRLLARLEHELDRLQGELDRLEHELDRLREATDRRVRDLESFHIEDRASARERIAEEAARLARTQRHVERISVLVAAVSMLAAGLEHFLHV